MDNQQSNVFGLSTPIVTGIIVVGLILILVGMTFSFQGSVQI